MQTNQQPLVTSTVAQWAGEYLANNVYPICKPSAAEHIADNLNKHLIPALGNLAMDQVTAQILQRFLNDQADHGNLVTGGPLSPKSVRNLRTVLNGLFSAAVVQGRISQNPVPNTVVRRSPKPVVQTLEDKEMETLMDFLLKDLNLANPGLILAAHLGLRRGEICALQWRNYDAECGYLTIDSTVKRLRKLTEGGNKTELVLGSAKTEAAQRSLALTPFLCDVIESQRDRFLTLMDREPGMDDFIVFNKEGEMTDPDNLSHYCSDVLAGLGIRHIKMHGLRHTFATRAVEQGIDIGTVSGLLGHTDATTTTHYYLHPRQQAMNKALWALNGAPGVPPERMPRVRRKDGAPHVFRRRAHFGGAEK